MPVKKRVYKNKKKNTFEKAYIVTVDMGYGHQRASHPLLSIAAKPKEIPDCKIINANTYAGIPSIDKTRWESGRKLYETVSRFKKIPFLGKKVFDFMDYLQRIEPFYPKRDLSAPSAQLKQIYRMIGRGWGKDLINKLNQGEILPYVTSFFTPAFFAEEHGYKGDIYCICTDTDVSRAWAPLHPEKSRIKYLAPNKRVRDRLKAYGVKEKNIFVSGFPLPEENIGKNLKVLKERLARRMVNLDPHGKYRAKYEHTLKHYLGTRFCKWCSDHPLTITFAVGGAGAQREIGIEILKSLHEKIDKGEVNLNLVAGSRRDVYKYYRREIANLHLNRKHSGKVKIIFAENKLDYFAKFNKVLLKTDILWTKPSELSFYAALGIPIIMAPSVGSQEDYNRAWLHSIGAGFESEDPRYTHEWLFDWLESGWLAEAAMEGFMDAPRNGAKHIQRIVLEGKRSEIEDVHLL